MEKNDIRISRAMLAEESISLQNARDTLSYADYTDLQNLYKKYQKDKEVKNLDQNAFDKERNELIEQCEIYGPFELYAKENSNQKEGIQKKKEWDQKADQLAEDIKTWIINVNHVVKELAAEEYEQNKNVFTYFLISAIEDDGQDYLEKKNLYKGKAGYIFHHAIALLPDKCAAEFIKVGMPSFRMGMRGYYKRIHDQSLKWADKSKNLSVYAFDIYQILLNELGKKFMDLKDEEGDAFSDVIMAGFTDLIEQQIPALCVN